MSEREQLMGTLKQWRYRVKKPFRVVYGEEDGQCFCGAPDFEEYGYGSNDSEARDDLLGTIVALLDTLPTLERGPAMEELWQKLQEYFDKRPGPAREGGEA